MIKRYKRDLHERDFRHRFNSYEDKQEVFLNRLETICLVLENMQTEAENLLKSYEENIERNWVSLEDRIYEEKIEKAIKLIDKLEQIRRGFSRL